jgi:hypothetical protein
LELKNLGLGVDNFAGNFIVTDRAINFVDIGFKNLQFEDLAEDKTLWLATRPILNTTDKGKKNNLEIRENLKSALKKFKSGDLALENLEKF